MQFYEYSKFKESIVKLGRRGASFSKAAKDAEALVGRVALGQENPLNGYKTTNNGETRIKNCIKYDLCGRSRLITVQTGGKCFLLFVGDHDSSTKWLDKHKGITFALDDNNELVEVLSRSSVIGNETPYVADRLRQEKCLYELLDEELFDRFIDNAPRRIQKSLEKLTYLDEMLLYTAVSSLDDDYQCAIKDVFLDLISGDVKNAERLIKLYLGDIKPVEEIDLETVVVDSEYLKSVSTDSAQYPSLLRKFAEDSEYKEWMLFMHPDQEAVAFADFNGPSKLLGVSGAGKTCVVVHRAIYLAKKYPGEPILVVTLNRPLAALIENLVKLLVEPEFEKQIQVQPFFKVCQDFLAKFEPKNIKLYDDVTWKSGEHIDEVWREYYRCELGNNDASILHELHDSLISKKINAELYIREEFDWIRSAFSKRQRNNYLEVERKGRTVPLNERFRKLLLKGLDAWEMKMKAVGVTDYLNISTALFDHIDKVKPIYRCVLIDECQDFGNIEFAIARKLVNQDINDLFFCGDAAQKISTKHQNLKAFGINVHGSRSKKITRNYRNSREILELANNILIENMTEEMLDSDDFEILDPEYTSFSGSSPLLLEAYNLEAEISSAITYVKSQLSESQKACICIAGFSQRELEIFANKIKFPVLNGDVDVAEENIFISDLEQTKGFEFDFVCILNCSEGVIPNPLVPEDEHFRELSRLYVAMTRAKLELILSFSGQKSSLFNNVDDYLLQDNWSAYVDKNIRPYAKPTKISEVIHADDVETENPFEMTGTTFLYREEAISLSIPLIELLRKNVDGQGKVRVSGRSRRELRVKWANIGLLLNDINSLSFAEHNIKKEIVHELKELESLIKANAQVSLIQTN